MKSSDLKNGENQEGLESCIGQSHEVMSTSADELEAFRARKVALITGISGQDGSYLAELLLSKGYKVHGIIRRSSSFNTARIEHLYSNPVTHNGDASFSLHYGDMTDSSCLIKLISTIQPTEVYHLAAQSHVKVSFDLPEYTAEVDAVGTLRLLDAIHACRLTEKVRFYQASTSELYGKVQEIPQSEKTPFYPRSPYAVAAMSFGWVTLVATPKSHEFEERRIKVNSSDDPVKIGRAVARIQASPENAVFDCKVLSRNHAILWYRDGEFWLKDTKSSNGTFVNNEKLQQTGTGRDTDVRRVFSGDIIQLGVEIVENSNKVAYGCIYAVINCFNSDGKLIENTGPIIDEGQRTINTLVSNRKLFQMQQYVSEAQHREKQREDKITELMSIIVANEKAAETAWKALVNEDRLLARIESLEAQLSVLSNNNNPDQQKEELLKMIDEKTKFEAMTKEMIRRLIEENGETTSRLKDMEQSLETTELTYQQLRSKNEDLELALAETTELNDLKATELEQATADLVEKQKVLTTYEEKLADLQQKNLKLSKVSVVNETASGLSRLLATAINNGSFIDEPELHLLINTLKSASYLPPHSREASIAESSSASESELRTQLNNGYATTSNSEPVTADEKRQQEDKTTIEVYLKTILELQAKNRELELAISSKWENQENMENLENSNTHFLEDACSKEPLEMSPTGNTSFFPLVENVQDSSSSASPQGVKKPSSIVKETDGVESVMLLVSLVPLLAFIMSVIAPIQRRFSTNTVKKEE